MAEILIKAVNSPDSDTNEALYQRGDIVVVRENNWGWGILETLPPSQGGKFVILKIPAVSVKQLRDIVFNKWGIELESSEYLDGSLIKRRVINLLVDFLPANVRNQFNNSGTYSTTLTAIRTYVRNKINSETL